MRQKSDLRDAQQRTATALYEGVWVDGGFTAAGAIIPMGGGKTAAALTAFEELQRDGFARDMFLLAPKRVAQLVWRAEVKQWAHLSRLRVVFVGGSAAERDARLKEPADVYCIGIDNTQWFVEWAKTQKAERFGKSVFCIDESSRFKNPRGKRLKALFDYLYRNPAAFMAIWELTGTPRPNGYEDLFGPVKLASRGKLWGRSFDKWRQAHCYPLDYQGYKWEVRPEAVKGIHADIDKLFLTFAPEDMPDLPALNDGPEFIEWVDMPHDVVAVYKRMEAHLLAELRKADKNIVAANRAVATGKLAQILQGFLYDEAPGRNRTAERLHDAKMDRLLDLIEEAGGEPVMVSYEFQEDLARLKEEFPGLRYLGAGVSDREAEEFERAWNAGKLDVAAVHPACLHPATLVLTEHRGWVKLIEVKDDERVFDGVEFVSHSGCRLSGEREVIDLFGLTMTPDHLVLLNGNWWVEARDVRGTPGSRAAARYHYEGDDPRLGALFKLRGGARDTGAERQEGEPPAAGALPELRVPPYVRHPALGHLEAHDRPVQQPPIPRLRALRRAWCSSIARVAELRDLLARHAGGLLGRVDDRAQGRERPLQQGELPLGVEHGATGEQAHDALHQLQRRATSSGRVLSPGWRGAWGDNALPPRAHDRGCGYRGVREIDVPARQKIKVYDLVDCGPRRRFVVRNDAGEVFVVHNSAGHGLNLQFGGAQLLHYGMTWSAELYDQLLKRFHRPGQHRPVWSRPILMRSPGLYTVDEMKYERVRNKVAEQELFRRLLKEI